MATSQPATFPITPYMFPADPVAGAYWSEENTDGSGTNNPPGDRRMVVSTPAFTLAPGASHVVDLGILFAQGEDRLGSITELRAVSDAVQAAYASGTLFAPAPPQSLLPAPELLSPAEGALFTDEAPTLEWSAVSGAESYIVEWSTDPAWADPDVARISTTTLSIPMETLPANRLTRMYWRVRAEADGMKSLYSSTPLVSFYRFQTGILLLDPTGSQTDPTNIAFVEVLGPGGAPVCSDGQPAGCAEVGGDQVYGSPNSTDQYIMYHGGSEGPEATIGSYGPNDFRDPVHGRGVLPETMSSAGTRSSRSPSRCGTSASCLQRRERPLRRRPDDPRPQRHEHLLVRLRRWREHLRPGHHVRLDLRLLPCRWADVRGLGGLRRAARFRERRMRTSTGRRPNDLLLVRILTPGPSDPAGPLRGRGDRIDGRDAGRGDPVLHLQPDHPASRLR